MKVEGFSIDREDLPDGLVGDIMLDIMLCQPFYQPESYKGKKEYIELVEETAKEIIEKILSEMESHFIGNKK